MLKCTSKPLSASKRRGGIAKGKYSVPAKSGSDYEPAFHICRKYLILLHLQSSGPTKWLRGEVTPKENMFYLEKVKQSLYLQLICKEKMFKRNYF